MTTDICGELKRDCLTRLRGLRLLLDRIEKSVQDDSYILNDLGELQSGPVMLDCRIAGLAIARRIRNESKSS